MEKGITERMVALEQQQKTTFKNIEKINNRLEEDEKLIQSLDKTLTVAIEQIKNIADDLKETSINLKETVKSSNTVNIKEIETMRIKLLDMEKDIENVKSDLKKETTDKELNQFRNIKSIILKWGITIALGAIAIYFGIKQ